MSSLNLGRFGRITISRDNSTRDCTNRDTDGDAATEEAPTEDATPSVERDDISTDVERAVESTAEQNPAESGHEPADVSGGVVGSRRRKSVGVMLLAVTGVVVIAALAIGTVLAVANQRRTDVNRAAGEVTSTVDRQVTAMLSYDHATVEKQLDAAGSGLTPQFRPEFSRLVADAVIPGAREKQINTKVIVAGSSIVSLERDRAELLMMLNQLTTSAAAPDPSTTGSRVLVTAVRSGDTWLVDSLKPI